MKTEKFNSRLTSEERETILLYDNITKKWFADTTVPKHMRKLIKMGWKQLSVCIDGDNNVVGGSFEAPSRAITIRSAEKKQVSQSIIDNLIDDDNE